MPRSHLTLAALVVAAVPDFDPVSSQSLSTNKHGEFDSACVRNADGRALVVRIPTNETAAADLVAQITVLSAMSPGVRSLMPFEVPTVVGHTITDGVPVAMFEYIEGNIISVTDFDKNLGLATTIGRSIAYIHQVPYAFAQQAGVPVFTPQETQRQSHALVERGRSTGLLPATLAERWSKAVDDDTLWQFTPTLVHGSLGVDRFLLGADSVSGVLGWGAARVADPAWDLHWLINLDFATAGEAFAAYDEVRLSAADPKVRQRAVLYSELELVRWLLHGVEFNRQEIIDDAVAMMDRLIDTVRDEGVNTVGQATAPVLSVTEVETLLASVPETPAETLEPIYEPVASVVDTSASSVHRPDESAIEPVEISPNDLPTEPSALIVTDQTPEQVYTAPPVFADAPVESVTEPEPTPAAEPAPEVYSLSDTFDGLLSPTIELPKEDPQKD